MLRGFVFSRACITAAARSRHILLLPYRKPSVESGLISWLLTLVCNWKGQCEAPFFPGVYQVESEECSVAWTPLVTWETPCFLSESLSTLSHGEFWQTKTPFVRGYHSRLTSLGHVAQLLCLLIPFVGSVWGQFRASLLLLRSFYFHSVRVFLWRGLPC